MAERRTLHWGGRGGGGGRGERCTLHSTLGVLLPAADAACRIVPLELAASPRSWRSKGAETVPLEYILYPSRSQRAEVLGRISEDWELLGHTSRATVGIKVQITVVFHCRLQSRGFFAALLFLLKLHSG